MTTYRYYGPSVQISKNLPCPVCGKKLRRQRTFSHTVNPFNKNPDGTQKTWNEVLDDVRAEAVAWRDQPETHPACQEENQ